MAPSLVCPIGIDCDSFWLELHTWTLKYILKVLGRFTKCFWAGNCLTTISFYRISLIFVEHVVDTTPAENQTESSSYTSTTRGTCGTSWAARLLFKLHIVFDTDVPKVGVSISIGKWCSLACLSIYTRICARFEHGSVDTCQAWDFFVGARRITLWQNISFFPWEVTSIIRCFRDQLLSLVREQTHNFFLSGARLEWHSNNS